HRRPEMLALAHRAEAQAVGLRVLAHARRVDRRAAARAEGMAAPGPRIGGLHIGRRLAGEQPERARLGRDGDAEGRAGQGLAVCTATHAGLLGISFGLEADEPAMAAPVDLQSLVLQRSYF